MNPTLGLRGLLSSKPNLKQEPFQTALSGSHLYCLSSCPRGAAIYGAERRAQPAGWSRLFTDLACLSGMRGRKRRRRAELGEIAWLTRGKKTKQRSLWRHQRLHFTSAQDFPAAHPVPGESHSSGVWLNPTNLLCLVTDRYHDVVEETKHASTRLHTKTNTQT